MTPPFLPFPSLCPFHISLIISVFIAALLAALSIFGLRVFPSPLTCVLPAEGKKDVSFNVFFQFSHSLAFSLLVSLIALSLSFCFLPSILLV